MKKRILAYLLCVVMVIGMFPTIALAAGEDDIPSGQKIETVPDDMLTWNGTQLTGVNNNWLETLNTFADVNAGMWCNTPISTMAKLGVVKGRSTEHFDPNAPITRAEFAVICARFDTSTRSGSSAFTDISGHWAKADIERAASLGWIMGYADGTFRPENKITRAEAMTMINRVLNRLPEDEDDLLKGMNVWPDNQPGAWYYLAVQEATNSHEFNRKDDVHERWTKPISDPDWTRYQN